MSENDKKKQSFQDNSDVSSEKSSKNDNKNEQDDISVEKKLKMLSNLALSILQRKVWLY